MTRPDFSNADRRAFMANVASRTLGVSFAGCVAARGLFDDAPVTAAAPQAKAKQIIYLFMDGAMSHLDTFDPKQGVEEAGETKPIRTRVPGMLFADRLPKLAYLAGALAVVRSLVTETGAHDQGKYLMRTSYPLINSIRHPGLGAWMLDQLGRINRELPGNFLVGSGGRHPGAGFLDPILSPVPIGNPDAGLENTTLPKYLEKGVFHRRLILANRFDAAFQERRENPKIVAYNRLYEEAKRLMGSEHLAVFDLDQETAEVRDAYGRNSFGQGCLLARRLVQSGARFVEVDYGGWDMHQDLYGRLDERARHLDDAVGALLRDLHANGLLQETLVVLTTEFGRTPKINANAGRDHHPGVFSSVLAGAGIRGGQVYGASDDRGFSVAADRVEVSDFNTTIAAAAGLRTDRESFAPNGRPFKVGGGGKIIGELLA